MGDTVKILATELKKYKDLVTQVNENKVKASSRKKMKYQSLKSDPDKIEEYDQFLQKKRKKSSAVSQVGKNMKKNAVTESQNNTIVQFKILFQTWKNFENDVLMNPCFKNQIENSTEKILDIWNGYDKLVSEAKQLCEKSEESLFLKAMICFQSLKNVLNTKL